MKTLKTSRSKQQLSKNKIKNKNTLQYDQKSQCESQTSIEFSVSYPSQTKRSQSPGLRKNNSSFSCECLQMRKVIQRLKNQNSVLKEENKVLKQEVQKFKKQNHQIMEIKTITSKRLQTKNIEIEQLRTSIKQLNYKIDKFEKINLNTSLASCKNLEDKQDTLTTICLDKEKVTIDQINSKPFSKKIQNQLSKYVDVKLKLDLTLRKLQQKQLFISFLQNEQKVQQF